MIGSTIGHYKITGKLGEGGMGEVYKAEDTELRRIVALKFIPRHTTASEEEQSRFLQEAQAAAALNHTNVCGIHSIDTHEGQRFIDMEFVDGVTIRQKMSTGPLKQNDAIAYAVQIAEALHEAHILGIVHRDVKAENIMVNTRNQIKVMDFGLAKLKGSVKLTRASSTIGTLAYMAPEQIQGGEVDSRSDLFSFGVVLYEMLAGQLPFRGEHEAAMMYSIVNEEPPPLPVAIGESLPDLTHILAKALDKDPEDRYQSAKEMAVDLRRLKKDTSRVVRRSQDLQENIQNQKGPPPPSIFRSRAGGYALGIVAIAIAAIILFITNPFSSSHPGTTDRKMLVVLPFQNQGSTEKDYFVDGITEEITSRLSGLSGLGVIARSSAVQYKNVNKPLKEIAGELGVDYALMGTVRWETTTGTEDRVRVNPELIKVSDATQVWSQPFEAAYSGSFKLQSQIASQVATALGVTLLTPERKSLEAALTENSKAYDFYLKGNDYAERAAEDKVSLSFAEEMYRRALELDPNFAAAYAQLSEVQSDMFWFHHDRSEKRIADSKTAAEKALSLDPNLALAHRAMAWYHYHGMLDYDRALESFRKAITLQPNDADALIGIGAVLRRQGKAQECLPFFEKAVEIDPRSSKNERELAWTFAFLGNFAEADRHFDRATDIAPDELVSYLAKAFNLIDWKGDLQGARSVLATVVERKVSDQQNLIDQARCRIEFLSRNYREMERNLKSVGTIMWDDQYYFIPVSLIRAQVYRLTGKESLSRSYCDSARVLLEEKIQKDPEDSRLLSSLAISLAGLGRKEDAIRKAKEAADLLPVSKEALRGSARVIDLAIVYALVGEQELAIDRLEKTLAQPGILSHALLRIDPVWDPLRDHPRFKKLIAGDGSGR
ncbi:MAG: protein kinase [Ignavibacteriales bacterium]|nr:protein kinase [Ignavibacteriales bacterium]